MHSPLDIYIMILIGIGLVVVLLCAIYLKLEEMEKML